MLGKEMDRIERVFLHGEQAPDTLLVAEEHQGLVTLQDTALRAVLDDKTPAALPAGGFYLIDPHGNLVLYFSPDIKPRDMVDDIKRLLKLSRIG
jgi:cytochrome oxidase Cu insertion factor (SCO1/SenC/PrrC family)